jgi:hypothetical protein
MPKLKSTSKIETKTTDSESELASASDNESSYETPNESEPESESDESEQKIKVLKNLKYDFASYEIKYIYETYLKNPNEINLTPPYQREFGWDNDKQDLFIDSIVNNYIIPPIILIQLHDKKGYKYECMDGQHRLTVLKHYIEGMPINLDDQHFIRYTNVENGLKQSIFYEKKKRFKNIQNHRFMTETEKNMFDDKKIIIIKISNYDPKLNNVFGTIKNEMFLRLQKGEKASHTDIIRNCSNPLIIELKNNGLCSYKTFDKNFTSDDDEDDDDVGDDVGDEAQTKIKTKPEIQYWYILKSVYEVRSKKIPQRLTAYLFFLLKAILIIKNKGFTVGNLTDNKIRNDILYSKTPRFNLSVKEGANSYQTFILELNKFLHGMKDITTSLTEPLLLLLLKEFVTNKENFKLMLLNIEKIKSKFDSKYFLSLFTAKINSKKVKLYDGIKLEIASKQIKLFITNNTK